MLRQISNILQTNSSVATKAQPRKRANARPVEPLEPRRLLAVDVLSYHNDSASTGLNASETVLTAANVQPGQFGRLFSYRVNGDVYAQPLIKTGVTIPRRGVHDVTYVATEHGSIYAFDANTNNRRAGGLLWRRDTINPRKGVTTIPAADTRTDLISPEIGITGTPVIDPATNTLYVVAATKEKGRGRRVSYVQRLYAINIANGRDRIKPVVIKASVPGTGAGSRKGFVSFNALRNNQRAGLTLVNGVVYIAWASHGDVQPYHGWVMGYDAATLKQVSVWNATPNGEGGGIWMGAGKITSDASGNLYLVTGDGTFTADAGGSDFGDSVVKLSTTGGLSVLDWFTPFNQAELNVNDLDLGSTDMLLVPEAPNVHPSVGILAGKTGSIYVVNPSNLGRHGATSDAVLQRIDNEVPGGVLTNIAYFDGAIYFTENGGRLKAFGIKPDGTLTPQVVAESEEVFGYPGATPSISANGTSNGIVWVIDNQDGPVVLRALNAKDPGEEYYNSALAARDAAGNAVKFTVPTVANGKVYVGAKRVVSVYGLLR